MHKDPAELVNEQDVVELTQALVRIPSQFIEDTLVQHQEMAQFLADYMRKIGLEVAIAEPVPDYPTVIGTTPGGGDGPTIGIIGHYSTVAVGELSEWTVDPFGAELVDGRIYGRGAADQKGGIAAVLVATKSLLESGLARKGRLRLLMVPGEGCTEMALAPVVEETPELVRADTYLDSDGGPGAISLVHGGWVWIELTAKGKGGHAGSLTADGTVPVNPVEKMVTVLARLQRPDWMRGQRHPLFGPEYGRHSYDPICDVTVFQAGSKVNIIPNEARAQIDIRMLPAQTTEGVLAELDAVLDGLRQADPELHVSYRVLAVSKNRREVSPDHPMIRLIQETCRELGEPVPELRGSIGGGRASLAKLGPVMHFGAGGGKGAHAPDEYAVVERLVRASRLHARVYAKALT